MDNVKKRLEYVELMWKEKRGELIYTRCWRAEAYLRFQIIDLKREHKTLTSLLKASTAV